tara:strand:+ start:3955 stop:5286 length:1332 start_codon:yes stop_codon:yes gene_type:complete
MTPEIVLVHAVDTEGPLYESVAAKFERLKEIFGVVVKEQTSDIFNDLLTGDIDVGVPVENLRAVFSNHLVNYNSDWGSIDQMLGQLYSEAFRKQYLDSFGDSWKITWHCLDHIGYQINPRKRDIGHHNIFEHYQSWVNNHLGYKDDLEWHFHPPSIFNEAHKCATLVFRNDNIYQILTRKIIDHAWFPTCFRAGFHAERPDLHWFLEQWIPFDLSNISQAGDERHSARDMQGGRFGDWRRAPGSWGIYQPNHDDYQVPGNCRRYIGRVLNVLNRLASIDKVELESAFIAARNSPRPILVGITGHDFRDLRVEIDHVYNLIKDLQGSYPDVNIRFETTKNGFRRCLWPNGIQEPSIQLEGEVYLRKDEHILEIRCSSGSVFGPQPFLAIKTLDGHYIHDNFDFQTDSWTYAFNSHTVPISRIEAIGVASNDQYGNCSVFRPRIH